MGAFFSSVLGSLFAWIAQYFTKKLSYGVAVAAAVLSATVAFYAGITALVNTLATSITNQYVLMGFYALIPANFSTCATAIFSAEILAFLYRHQLFTIKAVSSAS